MWSSRRFTFRAASATAATRARIFIHEAITAGLTAGITVAIVATRALGPVTGRVAMLNRGIPDTVAETVIGTATACATGMTEGPTTPAAVEHLTAHGMLASPGFNGYLQHAIALV